MKRLVAGNAWWIGKIDWELRKFHGNEYSAHRGSSYNSYLIREVKAVLVGSMVDSTFTGSSGEFLGQLVRSLAIAILVPTAIATLFGLALST